ncbi:MAG: hypothetical protein MPJ24_07390 [Pirellulaceae bacterium]|nr:hypothetical protein [Pirellulaceae bacterium]
MTKENKETETSLQDEELLTAYLDGELEDEQQLAFEARLQTDTTLANRCKEFQRSWQMLDLLPGSSERTTRLTESTMTMALKTLSTPSKAFLGWPAKRWLVVSLLSLNSLLLALISYHSITLPARQENQKTIEHIPVYKNLDALLATEEISFLKSLQQSGRFIPVSDEEVNDLSLPEIPFEEEGELKS